MRGYSIDSTKARNTFYKINEFLYVLLGLRIIPFDDYLALDDDVYDRWREGTLPEWANEECLGYD